MLIVAISKEENVLVIPLLYPSRRQLAPVRVLRGLITSIRWRRRHCTQWFCECACVCGSYMFVAVFVFVLVFVLIENAASVRAARCGWIYVPPLCLYYEVRRLGRESAVPELYTHLGSQVVSNTSYLWLNAFVGKLQGREKDVRDR